MTQPQHLTLPLASLPSSAQDDDDRESIHTPLLQPTTRRITEEEEAGSISSSSYYTTTSQEPPTTLITDANIILPPISNHHSEEDDHNEDPPPNASNNLNNIRLSTPLLLLFSLYGLTLSLPTLPLMYILNTRVALPLSLLPTYGALAFLPFSFKPLYAYWSSAFSRRFLLAVGWACCAMTSVGWTLVTSTPAVFVMGISNGVAMAWSGFLLGLTLLDQATQQEHLHQQHQHQQQLHPNDINTTTSFQKASSLFQSQAATARNVGSFAGSLLTCLAFGMSHDSKSKMNNDVTNALLWTTAACHMISFLVICLAGRKTFASTTVPPSRATTNDIDIQNNDNDQSEQSTNNNNDNNIPNTTLQSRHPSYSSMEVYLGNDDEGVSAVPEETQNSSSTSQPSATPPSLAPSTEALPWDKNIILIGTLQISLILLALKGPILDLFAHHPNTGPILGGVALATMSFLAARLYYVSSSSSSSSPWKLSHMVGLVLMLRHAIPSTSSILSAFLYQCLKNQPVWLQVFSLVDNGVVTLSSWSYQKLWATRYSHGRKLIHFMMVTTLLASLAQYLYVVLVRSYSKEEDVSMMEELGDYIVVDDDDDDGMLPSRMRSIFPWMVLAVKVVDTFVGEWNFLPDVVLATVSVTIPSVGTLTSNVPSSVLSSNEDVERQQPTQQPLPSPPPVVAPAASGVEYGSLISCIDFGDQLGNILASPIVSLLGITRENGWHHLDLMIQICVGLGILSVGILTLLLSWFPRGVAPGSRRRSFTGSGSERTALT